MRKPKSFTIQRALRFGMKPGIVLAAAVEFSLFCFAEGVVVCWYGSSDRGACLFFPVPFLLLRGGVSLLGGAPLTTMMDQKVDVVLKQLPRFGGGL